MLKAVSACLCEYFLQLNFQNIHGICRDRWSQNFFAGVVFFSEHNAKIYGLLRNLCTFCVISCTIGEINSKVQKSSVFHCWFNSIQLRIFIQQGFAQ